jgi:hypothetical protein
MSPSFDRTNKTAHAPVGVVRPWVLQYEPRVHDEQPLSAVAPVVARKVPFGHCVYVTEPARQYDPAGQMPPTALSALAFRAPDTQ